MNAATGSGFIIGDNPHDFSMQFTYLMVKEAGIWKNGTFS